MKRSVLFLAAVTAAMFSGSSAKAEDEYASHIDITATLAAYEQRMESYEQRIAELEGGDLGGEGCGCDDCCTDPCCRSCGIVGGVEVAFLRPHASDGIGAAAFLVLPPPVFGAFADADLEFDFETTPRLWVGYQGSNGLGVRARYWEFDHTVAGTGEIAGVGVFGAFHGIDTYVMDAEVTDTTELGCNWDATVFGGLRYVDYVENRGIFIPANGLVVFGNQFNSDSIGPTAGLELRCCVRENVALFGITRGSILMGTENEFGVITPGPVDPGFALIDSESNNVFNIVEVQLGVEATRPLADGGYAFARAALEAQHWGNFGDTPFGFGNGGRAVGFAGGTIAVGIVR